jgi:hypothetical protein
MGNVMNIIPCSSTVANTGRKNCKFDIKNITWGYLAPLTFKLTQSQMATSALVRTALQEATLNPQATRTYPLGEFVGFTDQTEEPTYEQFSYGGRKLIKEGRYMFKFKMDSGLWHHIKLRTFNNIADGYKIYLCDGNVIIGTEIYNSDTSLEEMFGFSMTEFKAEKWKLDDGAGKSADYQIYIELADYKEINENIGVIPIEFNPITEVKGLIDLEVVAGTAAAAKVAYVKVLEKDTQENIYDTYNGELDAIGVWDIRDSAGATVTPSVAAVAGTKEFSFTFVSAGTYTFTLASPATLAGAGIGGAPEVGYECSNTISIVVPA